MSKKIISKRLLSLCLALLLLVSLVPIQAKATSTQVVTLYFSNTDGWNEVYGYVWDGSNTTLVGDWPGRQLSINDDGLYELSLNVVPTVGGSFNFIFNNNAGAKTGDLSLSYSQLTSGNSFWVAGAGGQPCVYAPPQISDNRVTFTYSGSGSRVYVAGSFNGWSTSAAPMTKSGGVFTYTCDLEPGKYEYKFVVDGNWINDPSNPQITGNDSNNVLMVPGLLDTSISAVKGMKTTLPAELSFIDKEGKEQLRPVSYAIQGTASGVSLSGSDLSVTAGCTLSSCKLTASTEDGYSCDVTVNLVSQSSAVKVKLHFMDSLGWKGVVVSAWTQSSSGTGALSGYSWPGQVLQRDKNGFYTLEMTHYHVAGQSLGYLFHNNNGAQTQDLTISASALAAGNVELWIQPTGAKDSEKYTCTVTNTLQKQFRSVEVSGNQVTFRYQNSSASKVYVAGSFNNWSTTAAPMTKSGGVFTYTTTLDEGIHEYKFVVDGEWMLDPRNGQTGGYDGNSIAIVGDYSAQNTGKVTVKLHFYRSSGSYKGWDAWMWSATQEGKACALTTDAKGKVATFTTDGVNNSHVSYIIRKTDWSDQEFYDRSIDISNVVSGTVHYYLQSGQESGCLVYGPDVVFAGKPTYANYDYDSGRIWVKTSLPLTGTLSTAFSLLESSGSAANVSVSGVSMDNGGYSLTLSDGVNLSYVQTLKVKCGSTCAVKVDGLFSSAGFVRDYTYSGNDLGANWSSDSTTFKVWAPTATGVSVVLYRGGSYGGNDWISTTPMTLGDKGVWELTLPGDLHGTYYNYLVNFPTYSTEATDPYADTTGANGDRGMIVNLDSTDPAGWDKDISPNQGMSYTDAIIYEMHIREMTIDASSGVREDWRGTYLGLTQQGTNYEGRGTALSHLKELGITHVQLMPTYDFSSIDEYHLEDWEQYGWGYDPKNYNVPEGSYSTDPFNGEVRVTEFKQMVQSFHANGINVVMDVVYNHTYTGGDFCYNKIVPNYFSRFWSDGSWSNGSGVGNDIATERSMTRNYIVDSIMHWVEEYHVDGFRFDLAGLIDTQTINEIVNTVHAKYPHVMFYGEGWTGGGDTAVQPGYELAYQGNAWRVPGFGFFNDGFRNSIAGDNGNSTGFASGAGDKADAIGNYFRASNGWSTSPTQSINYVSCHDNYCLMDKLCLSRNGAYWNQLVKMNNLSAAIYMLAQGTPFIYSGEELLREKKNEDGHRIDNAHGTNDFVNKIRWSDLVNKEYAQMTDDYYAGLVAFRKNHAALRCANGGDAWNFVQYHKINDNCILFYVDGFPNYECSDGIVIIYNAQESTQWVNIYDYGVPQGEWQACIHGDKAGTSALWSTSNGSVGVEGISATVLVKGDLIHEESIYNQQVLSCAHAQHDANGRCTACRENVGHSYAKGKCIICGKADPDYVAPVQEYYLVGYINGADHGCEGDWENLGDYHFENGKLTATFTANSYVFLKTGDNQNWYMAKDYCTDTTCTFATGNKEKMFVPGNKELTFTLTENSNGSLTLSYQEAADAGVTVSGSITSKSALGTVTIELSNDTNSYAASTKNGSYTIEGVAAGNYTMTVRAEGFVTRTYEVTVGTENVHQDGKLCIKGDITGDGKVNVMDVARIYTHAKGGKQLTDYAFACADMTGDGKVNVMDTARAYKIAKA